MSLKNIYKSRLLSSVFVTRMGKALHFIEGKHITDVQEDIAELEMEIKRGHPHIYVDPAEAQIDTALQDAIAQATREAALKVIADFNSKKGEQGGNVSSQDPTVPAQAQTLTPATLLRVTSTADLGGLAAPSGQ